MAVGEDGPIIAQGNPVSHALHLVVHLCPPQTEQERKGGEGREGERQREKKNVHRNYYPSRGK